MTDPLPIAIMRGMRPFVIPAQCTPEEILTLDQLKQLTPYVKYVVNNFGSWSLWWAMGKFDTNTKTYAAIDAAFTLGEDTNLELLDSLEKVCKECITEQMIVQQETWGGKSVYHRVLRFERRENELIVGYIPVDPELGFDRIMQILQKRCPGAQIEKV